VVRFGFGYVKTLMHVPTNMRKLDKMSCYHKTKSIQTVERTGPVCFVPTGYISADITLSHARRKPFFSATYL